tara:strand:- start:7457 stop:10615 length:3159 start_codon:yes stop_codon:yes gene_type:complete
MSKDLLLEGGVPGHMNHIYDNGEMTFGELKQLLQAAGDGKLRGTEKTDGQNLSISFNVPSGRAVAARNKGQLKAGGLDPEELDNFFSGHPSQALRYSFVEALLSFENAVKDLDKDTLLDIFGNGKDHKIYFNVEVMNPGNPEAEEGDPRRTGTTNVIPYDKKTLLIHEFGHFYFDPKLTDEENKKVDVSSNYNKLERAVRGKETDDPTVFSVETHQQRKLSPEGLESIKKVLQPTFDAIDNLMQDIRVDDSDTINHYVSEQVSPQIEQFGLTEDINRMILKRVMKIGDYPGLPQITKGMPIELKSKVSQFVKTFNYANYTLDLQRILHDFSSAALEGFDSAFIGDNPRQIKFLQDKIKTEIDAIRGSSNERARAELEKQMIKLKSIDGVNTPSEGFVFSWNGVTYKFTGNFAPANQILGMRPFNRFGPIEPAEEGDKALKGDSEPLVIAILPGSFKPPHKGHRQAAETIAMGGPGGNLPEADKVYIIVSSPMKNSRPLPVSGKVISADQAKQMWQVMLEGSPISSKTQIIVADQGRVTPVSLTIDYVTKPADPTNLLVAPPNAKVIVGVGDKENDAKRFKGLRTSVENSRPDLELLSGLVPLVTHDPEYIEMIEKFPEVKSKMKKDYKAFNASDMRALMDVASEDPAGLQLLQYFLPNKNDALAYMGIMGLNPADSTEDQGSVEDQVEEPEVDPLQEILIQEAEKFFEEFKAQTTPKGRPDSGKFQKNMRNRLSKAHSDYLDQGRHDLTKHGGGFKKDRTKNASNAFLAEEDLDEMSSMASGAVSGYAGPIRKNKRDDEMTKEEKRLRKKIRIGLKEFFNNKTEENKTLISKVLEEHELRLQLRNIIFETSINEAEDPTLDLHDSTGMNTLKELFANSNILSMLRMAYQSLQTNQEQRQSFRAHIVQWTQDTLAPVRANDSAGEEINEEVDIDILGVDADKFIDADDGSQKEEPKDNEKSVMSPIEGEDTTGRNKASDVYPKIETSIISYYAILDNPEDQELFYDYLVANLKLYFDKWENEVAKNVQEPSNTAYDQAAQSQDTGDTLGQVAE